MHRVVVPGPLTQGTRVGIPDEEANHLRVRRASVGDPVELLDGVGTVGSGSLEPGVRGWVVLLETVTRTPPPAPLTLIVGAGDKDRFTWLVEKAVELGVTELIAVETERSRNVATKLRPEHIEKLQRRATEAMKQAGRRWEMSLVPIAPLEGVIANRSIGTRWLADEVGEGRPITAPNEPVTIVVGPEGGLAARERELVVVAGFLPVRFGAHTLRFETAALAAAAAVNFVRASLP